ncbi:UNVERIFIED_ORG: hypothetical protein FHR35_005150 [Microbispora rosea subsp. rosea]
MGAGLFVHSLWKIDAAARGQAASPTRTPPAFTPVDELKACGAEFARPQRMDDEV